MPTCPICHRSFRTLDDEERPAQHDCPRCGYGPDDDDHPDDEQEDERPDIDDEYDDDL